MSVLKNIFLHDTKNKAAYKAPRGGGKINIPNRGDKEQTHGQHIQSQLSQILGTYGDKDGIYLQVQGLPGYDLQVQSLENLPKGVRLLNFKGTHDKEGKLVPKATIFLPHGQESFLIDKTKEFLDPQKNTRKGHRKNHDLINSIENVSSAKLEDFWTGKLSEIPEKTPAWCEIWIRYDAVKKQEKTNTNIEKSISNFTQACKKIDISVDSKRIIFPERVVKLVRANKEQLVKLLLFSNSIAEIRRAPTNVDFFKDELTNNEQKDWVKELLNRVKFKPENVSVCILDTGVAVNHPLIKPAIHSNETVRAVEDNWSLIDRNGHGTEMAGIVLYKDLTKALESSGQIIIDHQLESVKILPDENQNAPELYGAITQQAVSLMEISNPTAKRVICMAITDNDFVPEDGSPSAWSADLDQISSGAGEGDNVKRLFIVSVGNVYPSELHDSSYPEANELHSVEDPAQAWNALSVGAYNDLVNISNSIFKGFNPVADANELSPYSSTSYTWNKNWPVKPEVLFRGGNMITNNTDFDSDSELELLTTNANVTRKLFSTISGTSSATAEASNMAAKLYTTYPQMWPETVRALIVHSARWTPEMQKQFLVDKKKSGGIKRLLHTCGYGVPDLRRAIECKENSVNLIIQDELQPYDGKKMNEMNFHKIPWPSDILLSLGEAAAKLHITLSYFIEPGPGRIGWKNRYRYPSAGLRFDVKKTNETTSNFKKRVNKQMCSEDEEVDGGGRDDWYLGANNRNTGSLHSDFLITSAAELAEINDIAIYPVVGWWRERRNLGHSKDTLRYSLVVSIETPDSNVNLYDAITTKISNTITY